MSMMSCSAQWHLRKAIKKDRTLLEQQAPQITKIQVPKTTFSFNCDSIKRNGVTLIYPRKYEIKGETRIDTVQVRLTQLDSSRIMAQVDCPDPEIIKYPPQLIEVKPGFWKKAEWFGAGVIGILLLSGLVIVFRKLIF